MSSTAEEDHTYPLNPSSHRTVAPTTPTLQTGDTMGASNNNINNAATTTAQKETNMVVVGILVGLIVVLTIILILLLIRPVMDFIRARLPENPKRKEMRYRTVEGWVISKRLRKHDELCEKAQQAFGASLDVEQGKVQKKTKDVDASVTPGIQNVLSYDTAETEQSMELEWKECPICMEDFKANEIVSWSPDDQTSCLHFFHHECIKEWLLRSPHCPYCRGTIIPVDNTTPGKKVDKLTLIEMSKRRFHKASTTFCCEEHGLVKLNRPKRVTRREKAILDAVLTPGVIESDLIAKRGGRQEGSEDGGSTINGDDVDDDDRTNTSGSDSEISSILLNNNSMRVTPLHAEDALPNNNNTAFLVPTPEGQQVILVESGENSATIVASSDNV